MNVKQVIIIFLLCVFISLLYVIFKPKEQQVITTTPNNLQSGTITFKSVPGTDYSTQDNVEKKFILGTFISTVILNKLFFYFNIDNSIFNNSIVKISLMDSNNNTITLTTITDFLKSPVIINLNNINVITENKVILILSGDNTKIFEPSVTFIYYIQKTTTTLQPTTMYPTTMIPTTLQPTTMIPTTLQPTTLQPTTMITTTLQPTTLQPTTMIPTTLQPTTLQPTTMIPTTMVPTTLQPTTMFPTTMQPTTLQPTTMMPTTLQPTTMMPTTLQPTTMQPTTMMPTTLQPTTMQPTTLQPTTIQPTTMMPTTLQPTTMQPTTLQPTTMMPTTLQPTTMFPTTMQPTTLQPTTIQPTTLQPTTMYPTTIEPTTMMPTTLQPTTMIPTTTMEPTTIIPTTTTVTTSLPPSYKLKILNGEPNIVSDTSIFLYKTGDSVISKYEYNIDDGNIYAECSVPINDNTIYFGFNSYSLVISKNNWSTTTTMTAKIFTSRNINKLSVFISKENREVQFFINNELISINKTVNFLTNKYSLFINYIAEIDKSLFINVSNINAEYLKDYKLVSLNSNVIISNTSASLNVSNDMVSSIPTYLLGVNNKIKISFVLPPIPSTNNYAILFGIYSDIELSSLVFVINNGKIINPQFTPNTFNVNISNTFIMEIYKTNMYLNIYPYGNTTPSLTQKVTLLDSFLNKQYRLILRSVRNSKSIEISDISITDSQVI